MKDMPYLPCRVEYHVENNPYKNLYVDLTLRCNMDCNYCYNPLRSRYDMDLSYFEEVCRRLPRPVVFKFLGGEPTLHPRFFDFIITARRFEHHVYFSSNGIKYTDATFMERLQGLGVSFSPGLSMDGGCRHNDIYELMNNRRCLEQKLAALENLHRFGIGRVALSAIIVRGVNEAVIGEILELAGRYSDVVRYVHFRSTAKVGRWIDTEPYTTAELKALIRPFFSKEQLRPRSLLEISCTPEEGGDCCYRFYPHRLLHVSLIEFASEKSARCPHRGKLLNEGFTIQPFFENMINVGKVLAEQYGEVHV